MNKRENRQPLSGPAAFFLLSFFLFLPVLPLYAQSEEDCAGCHGDKTKAKVVREGKERSVFVDPKVFAKSVHGDLDCTDCHQDLEKYPHEAGAEKVDCGFCHDDVQEKYAKSVHGLMPQTKGTDGVRSATCKDCHGTHDILASDDPESRIFKGNVAATCAACHSRPDVLKHLGLGRLNPSKDYEASVHARAVKADPKSKAPTCSDCHGAHEIYGTQDPRSAFSPLNVPGLCGRCHEKEGTEYKESIHWSAVERGHFESPVCNDCHEEHGIQRPSDPRAPTSRLKQSSRLCAGCHSQEQLMARFGLDARRFESYMDTYHGLAVLAGSPDAAVCTSCHEVHAIRSSLDPKSSVHPDHLEKTCGKCHDKVTEAFVKIPVHPVDTRTRNPIAFWVQKLYILLIVAVVGGMLLHNAVILFFYIRNKYRKEKECGLIRRFQPFEVVQHVLLVLSFFTLAVTGFALQFHDAFWVEWLEGAGLAEPVRALLHRIAGVVLVAVSCIQLLYLLGTRWGRRDVRALIPTFQDMKDFILNMKYHLGLDKRHPRYGRFDYTEKMEYIALIWGVIVMAATGAILWFPEFFAPYMPLWGFEVAKIVHLCEAILAVLAIVVWHWFFVIFHPDTYPLNFTMVHGKICESRLKEHHPLEFAEIAETTQVSEEKEKGSDGEGSSAAG